MKDVEVVPQELDVVKVAVVVGDVDGEKMTKLLRNWSWK